MRKMLAVLTLSFAGLAGMATAATPAQAVEWRYIGEYDSYAACQEAANEGQNAKQWTDYQCVQSDSGSNPDAKILYVTG